MISNEQRVWKKKKEYLGAVYLTREFSFGNFLIMASKIVLKIVRKVEGQDLIKYKKNQIHKPKKKKK